MEQFHKQIRTSIEPEAITPLKMFNSAYDDENINVRDSDDDDDNNSRSNSNITNHCHIERVHVVILVHGFIGCPQDLAYIHHSCEEQASKLQKELHRESEPFYVYTCVSNHGKTNDGIEAGADRVATEVRQFLHNVQQKHRRHAADDDDGCSSLKEMTISMIGYSLGGLYSRYALPKIIQPLDGHDQDEDPPILLTPKVFCTIATPHLGSKGHTFVPIPKMFQHIFGSFSRTGKDLFLQTNVINRTVTDPTWVEPLLSFERRITYANTHNSDMMVPTSTAAFVTPNSPLEHLVVEGEWNNPFVALVVETPAEHHILREQLRRDHESNWSPLSRSWDHTRRLDAMGWTKIFVDFTTNQSNDEPEDEESSTTEEQKDEQGEELLGRSFSKTTLHRRRSYRARRRSFQSSELHAEFQAKSKPKFFPNGHDQIAVNSKNALLSYTLRRGRPLIDQLTNDFIRDILQGPSPSLLSASSSSFKVSTSLSSGSVSLSPSQSESGTSHGSVSLQDRTQSFDSNRALESCLI